MAPEETSRRGDMTLLEALVISIVDDDRFAGDAIGELVRSLGYQTAVFPSAEQFWNPAASERQHALSRTSRCLG